MFEYSYWFCKETLSAFEFAYIANETTTDVGITETGPKIGRVCLGVHVPRGCGLVRIAGIDTAPSGGSRISSGLLLDVLPIGCVDDRSDKDLWPSRGILVDVRRWIMVILLWKVDPIWKKPQRKVVEHWKKDIHDGKYVCPRLTAWFASH